MDIINFTARSTQAQGKADPTETSEVRAIDHDSLPGLKEP